MEALLESPNALMDFGKHFTNELQAPFESNPSKVANAESPFSSEPSVTSQRTRISSDHDVDTILDRVAGLIDSDQDSQNHVFNGGSPMELEKMSLETKLAIMDNNNLNNMNPTDRLDRLEQLQKRRNKLESLLARTLKDINVVNPTS